MADRLEAALVTGASDGVGWHIARHLVANRKYHGILTTRDGRRLAGACQAAGIADQVTIVEGDVSRIEDVERVACLVEDHFEVRILVNNVSGWFEGPLGLMKLADIPDVISVTLGSALLVTRLVGEHMRRSGYGDILFLGTTVGTDLRPSLNTAFNAAKWGIRGLAKTLRREYQGTGIRIALVSLGRIDDCNVPFEQADQTSPVEAVLKAVDLILDMPRRAIVDEIVITPVGREY